MPKKDEREELRKEIERNVEMNPNPYAKAAFYGDPEVRKILEELYKRWESNEYRGEPLDYATLEELRILAMKSRRYRDATAYDLMVQAMGVPWEREERVRKKRLRSLIRKLFGL